MSEPTSTPTHCSSFASVKCRSQCITEAREFASGMSRTRENNSFSGIQFAGRDSESCSVLALKRRAQNLSRSTVFLLMMPAMSCRRPWTIAESPMCCTRVSSRSSTLCPLFDRMVEDASPISTSATSLAKSYGGETVLYFKNVLTNTCMNHLGNSTLSVQTGLGINTSRKVM